MRACRPPRLRGPWRTPARRRTGRRPGELFGGLPVPVPSAGDQLHPIHQASKGPCLISPEQRSPRSPTTISVDRVAFSRPCPRRRPPSTHQRYRLVSGLGSASPPALRGLSFSDDRLSEPEPPRRPRPSFFLRSDVGDQPDRGPPAAEPLRPPPAAPGTASSRIGTTPPRSRTGPRFSSARRPLADAASLPECGAEDPATKLGRAGGQHHAGGFTALPMATPSGRPRGAVALRVNPRCCARWRGICRSDQPPSPPHQAAQLSPLAATLPCELGANAPRPRSSSPSGLPGDPVPRLKTASRRWSGSLHRTEHQRGACRPTDRMGCDAAPASLGRYSAAARCRPWTRFLPSPTLRGWHHHRVISPSVVGCAGRRRCPPDQDPPGSTAGPAALGG